MFSPKLNEKPNHTATNLIDMEDTTFLLHSITIRNYAVDYAYLKNSKFDGSIKKSLIHAVAISIYMIKKSFIIS